MIDLIWLFATSSVLQVGVFDNYSSSGDRTWLSRQGPSAAGDIHIGHV